MATQVKPAPVEPEEKPGMLDKYRAKWGWFDHLMRMNERFGKQGGNQFAAGITYFSVLSLFPVLMLVFAGLGFALARDPQTLAQIQHKVTEAAGGDLGQSLNDIIKTAIEQRGAMAGIGGLTALWSGLGWMNNLRYGVSKMWRVDPTGEGFLKTKLMDLLGLIGLFLALILAFGVTALGNQTLANRVLEALHLAQIPGMFIVIQIVTLALALLANFLVFFWLIKYLPRTKVPVRSAVQASIIGAIAFEIFKRLGSMFFANALNNPAGATFGPVIGVMVLMYFVWRILLYCSAWAATTRESMIISQEMRVPGPATIAVRRDAANHNSVGGAGLLGIGALAGAAVSSLFRRK